ncbi:MAG: nucleotide exchange factor GrpE [Oscillospiraceae bacterium]
MSDNELEKQELPLEEETEKTEKTEKTDRFDRKNKNKKIDVIKAIQALENKLTETEKKMDETVKELENTKDTFQRTLAEYDNFRKRSAKEKSDSYANGKTTAVTSLLSTLDVLEIALNTPCKDDEYKKGIEMVMSTAKANLADLGVEEIKAVGETFDPNFHAAVMQEAVEGTDTGIITRQLQKGYKMGDKVIRPSTVAVAQ